MIDTSELMFDPDFCENFSVIRCAGLIFGPGGTIPNIDPITIYGAVQVADPVTLEMMPDGDRQAGARLFWSAVQLYETNSEGLSDVIVYHGKKWRVCKVWDRSATGFWKAYAVQMEGA